MALFEGVTTAATVAAVWTASNAFVSNGGISSRPQAQSASQAMQQNGISPVHESQVASQPLVAMRETLGVSGLLAYGAGAGALAAVVGRYNRKVAGRRVQRRAAAEKSGDIEVAEKEVKLDKLAYLQNVPNAIMDQETLKKLTGNCSKEDMENPPDETILYILKMYAETYGEGEGKSSRIGWWDYWMMRTDLRDLDRILPDAGTVEARAKTWKENMIKGIVPAVVPGPSPGPPIYFPTGATIKWRGPEPFAGDQTRSLISDGLFAKQFLAALAFYREGLKPWQRGIEIGMAHGYFIIGPFVSLGPLRNTPEAATVGLLSGCAVIMAASIGGLLFGTVMKPTLFDEEGDKPGKGYTEMINWHTVGGLGGAGFAHALITIFGS